MKLPRIVLREPTLGSQDIHLVSRGDCIEIFYIKPFPACIHAAYIRAIFYSWEACYNFIYKFLFERIIDSKTMFKIEDQRKELMSSLEITPKKLHKIVRGCINTLLMADLKPYITKLCLSKFYLSDRKGRRLYFRWRWDFNKIVRLRECYDKIVQLDKDGLMHLAPLVMKHNKDPHELKKVYGSAWRVLSKNSFNRNNLIKEYTVSDASQLTKFPTTILKQNILVMSLLGNNIKEHFFMVFKSQNYFKDMTNGHIIIYRDMMCMAWQLGKNPKPKLWSDVVKLHDKYTAMILEKECSEKSMAPITYPLEPFIIEKDDIEYLCTPIISDRALYEEGKKMHHCVYSYKSRIERGEYFVVHIENLRTNEHSTLGLIYNPIIRYDEDLCEIDQHYGYCNSPPKNRVVQDEVVKQINQLLEQYNDNTNISTSDSWVDRSTDVCFP